MAKAHVLVGLALSLLVAAVAAARQVRVPARLGPGGYVPRHVREAPDRKDAPRASANALREPPAREASPTPDGDGYEYEEEKLLDLGEEE
jgi:hypothetical protein